MRKEKTIKNFITSFIPFILLSILGFVRIDVFIDMLGVEIYALNQLFFQIFAYMSLIEAGVGVLIQQKYYKLLVDSDKLEINKVYSSSIKMLKKISIIMIIVGLIISFGLEYLTNNNISLFYMQIVFMLFLTRCVLEYLMISPRLVLQADQKIYRINVLFNFYKVIEACVEIFLLYIGLNYVIILLSSILFRMLSYYVTNNIIFKDYPWLKKVELNGYQPITGVKYVFAQRVAGAVSDNTTILLISAFLTPLKVTIYSSYNYILKFITDIISLIVNAMSASLGNVMHKENDKNKLDIFEELNAMFMFAAIFFTIIIYVVINKFVILWIGNKMLIDDISLIVLMFTLFHSIIRRPFTTIKNVNGLFKETQTIALVEAFIILGLSIPLIQFFGIIGAVSAIAISYLSTNFWFYPNYIYKNIFNMSPKRYYLKYGISILITLIICKLTDVLNIMGSANNFLLWFILSTIYTIVLSLVMILAGLFISKYFRRIFEKIITTIKNRRRFAK